VPHTSTFIACTSTTPRSPPITTKALVVIPNVLADISELYGALMLYGVVPSSSVTVTTLPDTKSTARVLNEVVMLLGIRIDASSKPVRWRAQILVALEGSKMVSLYWPGAALISLGVKP
jgi:hypothetical protein